MSNVSEFHRQQIQSDLTALENDPNFQLALGEMRQHLKRDFYDYEAEIAGRETFDPRDALSDFARKYAAQTSDLMQRITFALNAKHITIEAGETDKQLERRRKFMSEAEELLQIYHSEFTYDPQSDIPQQHLADAQYLFSYHDAPIEFRYYGAYRALEGYEVYLCERAIDNQYNQAMTINAIQKRWLRGLLENANQTHEQPKSALFEQMRKRAKSGDLW